MQIRKTLIFYLATSLLFVSLITRAQRTFSDLSTAYRYDIYGDFNLQHHTLFFEDSVTITCQLTLNQNCKIDEFNLSYEIQNSYLDESVEFSDSISAEDDIYYSSENKYTYQFSIPKLKEAKLLVLKITRDNQSKVYQYDIRINSSLNFGNSGLHIRDKEGKMPLLQSFVNVDEPISIHCASKSDSVAFVYYYDHDFEEALPPMIIDNKQVKRELIVDSIFSVPMGKEVSFENTGLYFIQLDTTSLEGISLRVEDRFYPTFRTMSTIIEPLIYISTGDETEQLRSARDDKAEFEKYWLKLASTPSKASETMQKFYSNVEEANYFFTNYKEGWKTDMGMIYIVYGKPDEVYNNEETIDWVYNRNFNLPIIRFTFIKIKNVFSEHHYSLMRKKNFDRHWMMSVKMWREGRK
jgi:GWxTD domain-containing protein